jgi:hypothetical protein
LSAVAARRARQQQQSTEQSSEDYNSPSNGGNPSKRTRSVPTDTDDNAKVEPRSERTARHARRENGQVTGKTKTEKSRGQTREQLVIGDITNSDSEPGPQEDVSAMSALAEEDNSSLGGQEDEEG